MLEPDDLVLCAGTVLGSGFRERAEAASAAGFAGITLWAQDWQRALDEGLTAADMRALLDDNGLTIGELDAVTDWLPKAPVQGADAAADADTAAFAVPADVFWGMAEALGARSLNVVEIAGAAVETERAAEAFAELCDRAAGYGLLVHLEFLPWSGIPDIRAAAEIVGLADRPNGGILLDTWHLHRSGGTAADLGPDLARRVNGIQISDAPALPAVPEVPADGAPGTGGTATDGTRAMDLMDETMHRRLLPGQGDADVAGVLAALRAAGVDAPVGVEVFSDDLARLGTAAAAQAAAAAARAVLAR
ncbi:sugar phosphate isomerase/epimerase [Streptomycetaceae bacterium NBC_01309]